MSDPQTFEGDVTHLIAVACRVAKSLPKGDPRRTELEQAADTVAEWGNSDDPQQMGWVGSDGRP
jgi:hypothetical protein